MKPVSQGVVSFVAGVVLVISLSAVVSAAHEVFVVSAEINGDASYMVSDGNGSFSSQENLLLMGADGLNPMADSGIDYYSWGSGMGDFDNDGDFDYIMGDGQNFGNIGGNIFLFEKIGSGNQFASPVAVAGWSSGYFPMDMAVADFDEDDKLDFVMSYYYSSDCGLYLGDGNLGFTGPGADPDLLLKVAAPSLSAGADAADFDNDGHYDFVIAPFPSGPSSGEPFFVNFGDGRGHFTTLNFEGLKDAKGKLVPYYGVAAADFTGDGKVDIAAAYSGYLDIYEGFGKERRFEWLARHEYEDMNESSLDNYDFDGDGNQDLVVANYGSAGADVAILLGNGDGYFSTNPVIYGGGPSGMRYAVSAPPQELDSNKKPVAVLTESYYEVTAGEEIVFDGSLSTDDDGHIVSYSWVFGDGTSINGVTTALSLSTAGGNTDQSQPPHIYYEAGTYFVTLTVKDDKGATATSEQAEVSVLPVAASIRFTPNTLYLNSKAKWIWATIRLPAKYDARKIDDPSVCIALADGIPTSICAYSDYGHGFMAKIKKRIYRKRRALTVKFNRQDLIGNIETPLEYTVLKVQGVMLYSDAWTEFEGSGKIRSLEKKRHYFSRYWKRNFKYFYKKCRSKYVR